MDSFAENSIYGLLAMEETKVKKPYRYSSKTHYKVKEEFAAGLDSNKTMGPAKVRRPQPTNYLIKRAKEQLFPKRKSFHYPDECRNKPPIPKIDDTPLMGLKTTRNLICVNTINNITSLPKLPTKRHVDTRHGDTYDLIPSGLEPVYTHKKDFGEVPSYLTMRKEEVERAQEEYDRFVAESFKEGSLKLLEQEDHKTVLDGLKANWEDIQNQYSSLPVITDTIGKKNRKERMEALIKQLERDIELLENHRIIYIGN